MSIGFFGAGKMATALAQGFVRGKLVSPKDIIASDPNAAARTAFAKQVVGARVVTSNMMVAASARVLILAVKPDQATPVLEEIRDRFTSDHLLVSIAAGVTLTRMESALAPKARVVRVMPNTPALVGTSATGFALGQAARAADAEMVRKLFSTVGIAVPLKEAALDAVTGLSGSGPAYVYIFIEGLSDGGVAAGLPRDVATRLAAQTVLGAAKMVLETGMHPGALKDMVTSPGGTTIEGVHELEKGKLRGILISAVRAATEKSRKLGQA